MGSNAKDPDPEPRRHHVDVAETKDLVVVHSDVERMSGLEQLSNTE